MSPQLRVALAEHIQKHRGWSAHNDKLFRIFEGELLEQLLLDLKNQLHERAYKDIEHRVAPINVLNRMLSKLSKIYVNAPRRQVIGGTDKDQELLDWYIEQFDFNTVMAQANLFFNMFKCTALDPFLDQGKPTLRVLPSDRFLVFSADKINPLRPTHFIKCMGKCKIGEETKEVFYVYSDSEFCIIDQAGDLIPELMSDPEIRALEGVNTYGKIPNIYINRSKHRLVPTADTDTLRMTKLLPILFSDLNYACMYSTFSIFYGIDIEAKNLTMSPNSFWDLKSDPTSGKTPQIGVIKPEVDSEKVLNLVKTQMSIWFQSRNIKPGSMGSMDAQDLASGISKVIDESDTSDDRKEQVPYFMHGEAQFWDLLMHHLHPIWVTDPLFEQKALFSPSAKVRVQFPDQKPDFNGSQTVDIEIKKLQAGLTTKKRALKTLNPEMSEDEVEALLEEIDPTSGEGGAPTEDVRKETLNGAQIDSMVTVVQAVGTGQIPRESAVQIIARAFNLSQEEANELLGSPSFKIVSEEV